MFTLATIENSEVIAVEPKSMQDAKTLYNAINNPTATLADVVNQPLRLVNAHLSCEERADDDGNQYVRYVTTLVCEGGKSYACTYKALAKSVVNILNTFGAPDTWSEPLTVIPRIRSYGGGFHDTIVLDVQ